VIPVPLLYIILGYSHLCRGDDSRRTDLNGGKKLRSRVESDAVVYLISRTSIRNYNKGQPQISQHWVKGYTEALQYSLTLYYSLLKLSLNDLSVPCTGLHPPMHHLPRFRESFIRVLIPLPLGRLLRQTR
jgi:hypothetical protein